jgi:hypothetical protein
MSILTFDTPPTPEESLPSTPDVPPTETDTPTIVVDGPLGTVYTKALMAVFGKQHPAEVATESQANDTVLSMTEYLTRPHPSEGQDHYLYATDVDTIEAEGAIQTFDKLRVALDHGKYRSVAVCIESNGKMTAHASLLSEYLIQQHVPVFRVRGYALEQLTRLYSHAHP